jgi:sn1-specific diacylglycerol lipase
MTQHDLYPPGRVLWALRDGQLHPSQRIYTSKEQDKLRLFEVSEVDQVFSQIVFAKDMLRCVFYHNPI